MVCWDEDNLENPMETSILFKKNDDTPEQLFQCCYCCCINMKKDTLSFHIMDFFITFEILINYGILKDEV